MEADGVHRPQRPLNIITRRPLSLRTGIRELWEFRETVWAFGARHVRVKYKQTLLGVAWAVLQPISFLIPFAIFFGHVAKITGGGVPYAAFALSALVPWQFVSGTVTLAANSVLTEADLVRKVYFPREAPVVGTIGAGALDLMISLPIALIGCPLLGGRLGLSLVLLPLLCLLLILPVLAICLPLAAMNVYYRDFRYVLPLLTQLWLFVSPVIYPISAIPGRWRWVDALINPTVGPLDGFRRVLTLGAWPDWEFLGLSCLSATLVFSFAYRGFKRFEAEFGDVI